MEAIAGFSALGTGVWEASKDKQSICNLNHLGSSETGRGSKITACFTSPGLVGAGAPLPPASSRAFLNVLAEEVIVVGWAKGRPGGGTGGMSTLYLLT